MGKLGVDSDISFEAIAGVYEEYTLGCSRCIAGAVRKRNGRVKSSHRRNSAS
jgi:hypothetical protein